MSSRHGCEYDKEACRKALDNVTLDKVAWPPSLRSANKGERSRTHINSLSLQPTGGQEGGKLQWLQRVAFDMNTKIAFMIHTDFTIIY